MPLWILLTTMGFVKLVLASLMLWLPYRSDTAMVYRDDERRADSDSDDEGGSKTLGGYPHPRLPLPKRPRRGPHGSSSSPPRIRAPRDRSMARSRVTTTR
jgi:hypothetical protein